MILPDVMMKAASSADLSMVLQSNLADGELMLYQTDRSRDLTTLYCAVHTDDSSDIYRADTGGHHKKVVGIESSSPLLGLYWYTCKRQLVSVSNTGEPFLRGEKEEQERWQQLVRRKIGEAASADGR
ncbi:hypothetical protein ABBQ38_010373 [Trebouxia sp. C0009 RCD-2024]